MSKALFPKENFSRSTVFIRHVKTGAFTFILVFSILVRTMVFKLCFCLFPVDNGLLGSKPEALVSAAAAKVADRIFIFGGFNGEAHGTLFRLTLPSDLCQALTSKEKCNAVNICSWCEVHNVTQEGNLTVATNQSACYSVTSPVPAVCHAEPNVTQVFKIKMRIM